MSYIDLKNGRIVEGHDCANCRHNSQKVPCYPQIVCCEKHMTVYIGGQNTLCPDYEELYSKEEIETIERVCIGGPL